MENKIRCSCAAAAWCLLLSASASADVLYSNGPVNGTINAYTLYFDPDCCSVADSFTLASNSTVTGVGGLGFWLLDAGPFTPATLDWSIWSSAGPGGGGSILDSGTGVSLANTFDFAALDVGATKETFDIYTSSFSIPSISLIAGTYWLQLDNGKATVVNNGTVLLAWDQNNGPSEAWYGYAGGGGYLKPGAAGCTTPGPNGYCSESFDIIGTPNASTVPEPRGIFLFGTALTLIGAAIRKRFGLLPIGRER
jgi:hypothetical protein